MLNASALFAAVVIWFGLIRAVRPALLPVVAVIVAGTALAASQDQYPSIYGATWMAVLAAPVVPGIALDLITRARGTKRFGAGIVTLLGASAGAVSGGLIGAVAQLLGDSAGRFGGAFITIIGYPLISALLGALILGEIERQRTRARLWPWLGTLLMLAPSPVLMINAIWFWLLHR